MINFEQELNPEQLEVVLHGDGPCLVLAGAGSGKTRTITYRVAYLLEKGIAPENILLVTFTNKAAGEMKERLTNIQKVQKYGTYENKVVQTTPHSPPSKGGDGQLTPPSEGGARGGPAVLPWSGTFHHIGYRILRQYAPLLGFGNNFTVLDSDDSDSLLKISIKEFKSADVGQKRFPSARALGNVISYSRNASTHLAEVIEERYPEWLTFLPEIERVAADYSKRKKEANAMDFDDLLVNLLLLLQSPQVAQKFATQFKYILVDEYQDTNTIQAAIIKRFSTIHNNVLVVGDDAQSIYSFRAADIANILEFEKDYPGAHIFKLETNYRSSQEILEVANSVIENNRSQYKKHLKTILRGALPELYPQLDQQSEGQFIAEKIVELIKSGTPPEEISVLFRAAHHSQMLEVELVKLGIPYDYRGGVRFFERSHIKDILAYLRLLNNSVDTAAWLRVLLHEEGVGPAAADKVIAAIRAVISTEAPRRSGEIAFTGERDSSAARNDKLATVATAGRSVLSGKALAGFENFLLIWNKLLEAPLDEPGTLIENMLASPYREYLEAEFVDSRERLLDIKQLMQFSEGFDSLSEFLASTTLQESFQFPDKNAQGVSKKIVLSTIHQAKGLEWSVVFIMNLASGSFPSDRALREANGLEEERRLFYVAVTRAKKLLFLTYPMAGGAYGDFLSGPGQFLDEIDPGLIKDRSLLSTDPTVLDDDSADVHYVTEAESRPFKPGSFLRDVEDL